MSVEIHYESNTESDEYIFELEYGPLMKCESMGLIHTWIT